MLLLLALLQDAPTEMKWAAEKDDKFELKWIYDEVNTRVGGTGDKSEIVDKRAVEAELVASETPGRYLIALKKVGWTYGNNEWTIALTFAAGKPPTTTLKMKIDPKDPKLANVKPFAEARAEQMKKLVGEGEYVMTYEPNSGETYLTRNGSGAKNTSLFDLAFLHSPLPKGTVNNGQTWKESLERVQLPQLVEVKVMNNKVTLGPAGASIKGGFQQPINRPPGAKGEVTTGKFDFLREFTFSRDGYLASSKEEQILTRKVDAKEDFYRENANVTVKQSTTFKKIVPPKPPAQK